MRGTLWKFDVNAAPKALIPTVYQNYSGSSHYLFFKNETYKLSIELCLLGLLLFFSSSQIAVSSVRKNSRDGGFHDQWRFATCYIKNFSVLHRKASGSFARCCFRISLISLPRYKFVWTALAKLYWCHSPLARCSSVHEYELKSTERNMNI